MRLTKKKNHYDSTDIDTEYKLEEDVGIGEVVDKLGQYEDIERELGIDLITLIECIRNEKGVLKKDFNGGLINTRCMLACYFGKWQIYDKENIYELKDYGKTWALTKEELEKC